MVVRKVNTAIPRINHFQADSEACFVNTYDPLDSDLSGGGKSYPAFEQLGPGAQSFIWK